MSAWFTHLLRGYALLIVTRFSHNSNINYLVEGCFCLISFGMIGDSIVSLF